MAAAVKLPTYAVESSSAYFWKDNEDIINVIYKPLSIHTRKDAISSIADTVKTNGGNFPEFLLIDLTDIRSMTRDAREEYKKVSGKDEVRAIALLTASLSGRLLGNFFLSFNRAHAPIKLFSDYDKAHQWLLSYKNK